MISSLRAGEAPPPKPSAVSAKPSSWNPPVIASIAAYFDTVDDEIEADDDEEDGYTLLRYVVELKLGKAYVSAMWEAHNAGAAETEFLRQCAHKSLIKMCALIGVRVGYELVLDPTDY